MKGYHSYIEGVCNTEISLVHPFDVIAEIYDNHASRDENADARICDEIVKNALEAVDSESNRVTISTLLDRRIYLPGINNYAIQQFIDTLIQDAVRKYVQTNIVGFSSEIQQNAFIVVLQFKVSKQYHELLKEIFVTTEEETEE